MPTIAEIRQKYPTYDDLSDEQLADALHGKYYSDMPKTEFRSKIGMSGEAEVKEAKEPEGSGVALNATAGVNEGIYNTLGAPVDFSRWLLNKGIEGGNYLFDGEMPTIPTDSFGGSESISSMFGAVGVPEPKDVVAATPGERIARGAGQGVGYTVGPGALVGGASRAGALTGKALDLANKTLGTGSTVGELAGNTLVGATSGAGAEAAMEAAPEEYDALAGVGGGLAGGVGGAVVSAIPAMVRGGARVVSDAVAPLHQSGRERLAAQQIADEATNVGAVKASLADQADELVPGSQPTTFQLTGDMGLGGMERGAAAKRPDLFNERRADQNVARRTAMEGVQAEGAPETVAKAARQFVKTVQDQAQAAYDDVATRATSTADDTIAKANTNADAVAAQARADLDNAVSLAQANADTMTEAARSEAERNIAQLRQQADQAAELARQTADSLGAGSTPTGAGETMRSSLEEARAAAKATERALWGAVDPDGTLALPAQNTRQRAASVISELPQSAKPPTGEEAAIFDAARTYGDVIPFNELTALQSRIKAELRAERLANGESPAYRRLSQLNAATEADIEAAVAGKMDMEAQAVARGEMAENQTLASMLQGKVDDWRSARAARTGSQDDGAGFVPASGGRADTVSSDGGAGRQAFRGPRLAEGNSGVSGTSLDPNFDAGAADRLKAARSATRERVETFDNKTLGAVRKRPSSSGPYDMAAESVPNRIFYPRPESATAIEKYRKAVGKDVADQQIEAYAIDRLRKAGLRDDGTLDAKTLATFRRGHADALRTMPELDAKLANVETASRAMAETGDALTSGAKAITKDAEGLASRASASVSRMSKDAEAEAAARIKAAQAEANTLSKEASSTAGKAISEAAKRQKETVDEVQRSRLGQLMNLDDPQDVTRNIGGIFSRQDAMKEMRKLRNAVGDDAEAKQGLRKAIVDHVTGKFVGNTEAGTSGESLIKSDQFQTFMKNHSRTLEAAGFTKDEIKTMEAIAADLRRANRSITAVKNPGGSNTAQDALQVQKGDRASTVLARVLMAGGAGAGYLQSGGVGALAGALGAKVVSGMRAAGLESVDDIVADALLNPERARILLSKMPVRPDQGALDTLAKSYRKSAQATAAVTATEEDVSAETPTASLGKTSRGLDADGSRNRPVNVEKYRDLKAGADRVNTEPSDAQKKAGNYSKLHARVSGFDVAIENPAGSTRKGKARNGREWEVKMPAHYGYIKGSKGADGDPIDVFVGKKLDSDRIYIIDQINPASGQFDEHKVIMGASSPTEARELYEKSFSDGRGAKRLGAMQPMDRERFRKWLGKSDHSKPVRFRGQKFGPVDKEPLEITVTPKRS